MSLAARMHGRPTHFSLGSSAQKTLAGQPATSRLCTGLNRPCDSSLQQQHSRWSDAAGVGCKAAPATYAPENGTATLHRESNGPQTVIYQDSPAAPESYSKASIKVGLRCILYGREIDSSTSELSRFQKQILACLVECKV